MALALRIALWQQRQLRTQRRSVSTEAVDTLIIGGGPVGLSVGYHLAKEQRNGDGNGILVVDRDWTHAYCSATRSAGGIRQQFSVRHNIEMSRYGYSFLQEHHWDACEPRCAANNNNNNTANAPCDMQFVEGGYLFLASTETGADQLRINHQTQKSVGWGGNNNDDNEMIRLLTPEALQDKFPWLNADDLLLGSYGASGEGWFDPWSFLQTLKLKNQSMGITHLQGHPVSATVEVDDDNDESGRGGRCTVTHVAIQTPTGGILNIAARNVVNAAGARASDVLDTIVRSYNEKNSGSSSPGRSLQCHVPVEPRKRCIFFFHCASSSSSSCSQQQSDAVVPHLCPLTVDTTGVYFRTEGIPGKGTFLCGVSPANEEDDDDDTLQLQQQQPVVTQSEYDGLFHDLIWPSLYHRVPAFGNIKVQSYWAGYYDYNTFDQNAIIDKATFVLQQQPPPDNDPCSAWLLLLTSNVFLVNGFSGHGLQHSPAAGRGVAELIDNDNQYQTLDMNIFRYPRKEPILELGIV